MAASPRLRHVRAAEHALPYRVIFEELFAIGKDDPNLQDQRVVNLAKQAFAASSAHNGAVAGNTSDAFSQLSPEDAERLLFDRISEVERAYEELADSKRKREYRTSKEAQLSRLETPLLDVLHHIPRSALCFSGGGIRSAAYSLGVLQALSRFRRGGSGPSFNDPQKVSVLEEFDYLSTVSGGGYIGSWLTAWTHRAYQASLGTANPLSAAEAFHAVTRGVAGDVEHTSGDPARRPIRHLREYTSFLAPKLGLTLDTWTLAALVLRNLLVNWIMIVPVILALVAGLQMVHYGIFDLANLMFRHPGVWWWVAAGSLFTLAGITAGRRMPSCPPADRTPRSDGVLPVLLLFIFPLIFASLFVCTFWANLGTGWVAAREVLLQRLTLASFITLASVPVTRLIRGRRVIEQEHSMLGYLFAGLGAALLTSVLLACTVYTVGLAFDGPFSPGTPVDLHGSLSDTHFSSLWHHIGLPPAPPQSSGIEKILQHEKFPAHAFAVLGFPLVWLFLIAASALFSGLLGIFEEDVDREWWARAGGLMMGVLMAWIVGESMVIFAPHLTGSLSKGISTGLAALTAGLFGALGGASTAGGLGAAAAKSANVSKLGQVLKKYGLLVPVLCGLALLIFGALIADFEQWMANRFSDYSTSLVHLVLFVVAVAISFLANWAININIFSLHGMYRMRLMRAFLGASNTQRVPNPFTGFDDRDTVYEHQIVTGPGMPLHLINTTVNLLGTNNLAWRQRKAEGFTISPLHCGGWRLGYTKTEHYGRKGGLSLSTAMAISGAAFNPNMGYHSSPLVTLVMTLFNVRLGWWLPNPRYQMGKLQSKMSGTPEPHLYPADGSPAHSDDRKWDYPPLPNKFLEKKAPRLALGPLLRESLGGTDDEAPFIELTDGGHFENLGLYEMVLRRTRWIVVVDASADPKCQLEDLGNAIRKVEIDLGVPIVFDRQGLRMKEGSAKENLYCAIADIRYDVVDPVDRPMRGQLLYIKAGLNGNEPPDITQYARTHQDFPHEATANQFFNESQFESYRHLGHHALHTILTKGDGAAHTAPDPTDGTSLTLIQALFAAAETYTGKIPARKKQPLKKTPEPQTLWKKENGTDTHYAESESS
jgi:hypothetical protein